MRNRFPLDIYTILIIAIVPVFLATAWGLTWNHERVARKESCDSASAFLTDASGLVPVYTDTGSLDSTDIWLSQLESLTTPPGAAKNLRENVLSSMTYAMNTDPNLETTGTGEVYDALTPFQQSIDKARTDLVKECPDTSNLIPEAFPMFFRTGANP